MQCFMRKEDNSLIDVENVETTGERCCCFMRKEDNSLIDVENVETTGERCCHLS